jgi:hypothetical protein
MWFDMLHIDYLSLIVSKQNHPLCANVSQKDLKEEAYSSQLI